MGFMDFVGNGTTKNSPQRTIERLMDILVYNDSDILIEALTVLSMHFGNCDITVLDSKRGVVGSTLTNVDYIEMAKKSVSARPFTDTISEVRSKELREGVNMVTIIPLTYNGNIAYYLLVEQYGKSGHARLDDSLMSKVFGMLSIVIRVHIYEHNAANIAYMDSVTNLGNRDGLIRYLQKKALKIGDDICKSYSLIMVKILNMWDVSRKIPGYGQPVVDELTRKVAFDMLQFNGGDNVYRISHDSLVIVYENDLYNTKMAAENLIEELSEAAAPFTFCAVVTSVTVEPHTCIYACECGIRSRVNTVTFIRHPSAGDVNDYVSDFVEVTSGKDYRSVDGNGHSQEQTSFNRSTSQSQDDVLESGSVEYSKAMDVENVCSSGRRDSSVCGGYSSFNMYSDVCEE